MQLPELGMPSDEAALQQAEQLERALCAGVPGLLSRRKIAACFATPSSG